MEEFILKAKLRSEFGSKAARQLREQGLLPANIYGHNQKNLAVSLDEKEFARFFEAGHRVAVIQADGNTEHGVVKEVQYDAYGDSLVHVDFSRISRDERIVMEVPVETLGVAKGVAGGGVLEFPLRELRVEGPAHAIPEHFEINIEELKVGEHIRVRELTPPSDCRFVDDGELVVIGVSATRATVVEAVEEEAMSEPEVVGRKKEDEEGTEEEEKGKSKGA